MHCVNLWRSLWQWFQNECELFEYWLSFQSTILWFSLLLFQMHCIEYGCHSLCFLFRKCETFVKAVHQPAASNFFFELSAICSKRIFRIVKEQLYELYNKNRCWLIFSFSKTASKMFKNTNFWFYIVLVVFAMFRNFEVGFFLSKTISYYKRIAFYLIFIFFFAIYRTFVAHTHTQTFISINE